MSDDDHSTDAPSPRGAPADDGPADDGPADDGPADDGPADDGPDDDGPDGASDPAGASDADAGIEVSPVVLRLEATQQVLQRAEAERIVALLDGFGAVLDGEEPLGCEGLPFEVRRRGWTLQAGLALHKSERAITLLLNAAWTARAQLPAVWERFTEGGCSWQLAEIAVRQSHGLEGEALAAYDRKAVQVLAQEGVMPPDALRRLHVLRERLQGDAAAKRRERAAAERTTTIEPRPDGQAALTLIGPAVEIVAAADALTQQAVAAHGVEGETRSLGALRLDVALDLLLCGSQQVNGPDREPVELDGVDVVRRRVPARGPVAPTVLITIPAATAAGCSAEPGVLAGYGPIDPVVARSWAGTAGYWTRVLLDPITGGLKDIDRSARYIPPALRRWLGARDDTCRAPGCRIPAPHADLDHVTRFEYGGPTDPANLVHLCRPHHHDKDDGMWSVRLHPDGAMTWSSRWGRTYRTEPAVRVAPAPESEPSAPPADDPAPC